MILNPTEHNSQQDSDSHSHGTECSKTRETGECAWEGDEEADYGCDDRENDAAGRITSEGIEEFGADETVQCWMIAGLVLDR